MLLKIIKKRCIQFVVVLVKVQQRSTYQQSVFIMVIWHSILLQMLLHEMYIAPCYKKDLRKQILKHYSKVVAPSIHGKRTNFKLQLQTKLIDYVKNLVCSKIKVKIKSKKSLMPLFLVYSLSIETNVLPLMMLVQLIKSETLHKSKIH